MFSIIVIIVVIIRVLIPGEFIASYYCYNNYNFACRRLSSSIAKKIKSENSLDLASVFFLFREPTSMFAITRMHTRRCISRLSVATPKFAIF